MKLEKIWAVYFSGTGTTRRTVERIAGGIASRLNLPAESVDFSRPAVRQETLGFGEKDLVVFGTPVYAGRVPNVLLPFLRERIVGGGALAVPVVLFGNRNYDDALIELRNILAADGIASDCCRGFCGGTFVFAGPGRRSAQCRRRSADGRICCPGGGVGGGIGCRTGKVSCRARAGAPPTLHAPGPGREPHQYIKG